MSSKDREFRWRRFPPLQFLLYLLVRSIVMVIDMFPYEAAPRIAGVLSRVLLLVDRKHARIAAKNLEKTRGICPRDGIPAFIERVYGHIGLGFVEMLMIPRLMERHALERFVLLERFEVFRRGLDEGKGVIAVIGHLGNWELGGLAVTKAGWPLNSLARPVENPWLDRYLNRFRTSTGQEIISKYRALGSMIRVLQRNEILVIQIDQDARHSGVYVDFFGRPASTQRGPAILSLKYGSPIVIAEVFRDAGGVHRVVLHDPIRPDDFRSRSDPVKALTQAISDRFEDCVRRHPEQWFWVHDRWKTAERQARVSEEALT
jgi:KDO2-lipid IV(A) lauroyltransferase